VRLVVIGSAGRVGAALARHFRQRGHAVIVFDRKALDLTQATIIRDRLEPIQFDACVNAAALTNVDYCENHPAEALAANATGPALVAQICHARRARFVQLSTDYVYDGNSEGLRRETDPTGPVNGYAASKLEGDRLVLETSDGAALVVRTSWVFGPDRPSFPDSIIERAQKQETVEAIADKTSTPTYSLDLAAHLEPFVTDPDYTDVSGILNLCNTGVATWHSYGQKALDIVSDLGLKLRCRELTPTALSSINFRAARPRHTAMAVEKYIALTGRSVRAWQEALTDYLRTYYSPGPRG
jgi:dTDP-4-dehydrorhamnose reductase